MHFMIGQPLPPPSEEMKRVIEVAERIRKLEIQSATTIAKEGLTALRSLAAARGFKDEFERACKLLVEARPTGISLYNAIQVALRSRNLETIDRLLKFNFDSDKKIAAIGAELIEQGARIVTHCHSTAALAVLLEAKDKISKVYVTETRPILQGIITARALLKEKVPIVYIVDSAVGYLFEEHDVDFCLVGADAVKEGGVINKLGTYLIAAIANDMDVPFYVATNTLKFDYDDKSVIEMRSTEEVLKKGELPGAEVLNPAFDITPWKFITGVITERGVITRSEAVEMLKRGFRFG